MTDISVIKMIISVAVWRIYPSWMNDKLRAWEGLGYSGMFWARISRDDFRSKLENISFLSRVMFISKSFSVSRAFVRFGAKRSSSGAFGFDDVLELFWKLRFVSGDFLRTLNMTMIIFLKIAFIFSKQSRCHLPDSCGDLQAEQSTFVMVRRKLEWKLDFRTLARSSADRRIVDHRRDRNESLAVIHGLKEKKTQWSQSVVVRSINPSSFTKSASFRSLFRRPDVATVLHFTVFLYVDAQLQVGQAAARGRAKRSSHPWHFRCWSPKRNELECTDLVPLDSGITPFFVTWCNYHCWFCVRKALWRWFYPRSRKRDHFQTLATGVPNLKT